MFCVVAISLSLVDGLWAKQSTDRQSLKEEKEGESHRAPQALLSNLNKIILFRKLLFLNCNAQKNKVLQTRLQTSFASQ